MAGAAVAGRDLAQWLERDYDEAGLKARFTARGGFGDFVVERLLRRE